MIANHIHDALAQVRKMRELLLERQGFRGYSGTARILGGIAALLGAAVMSAGFFPPSPAAHLAGWGVVLAAALLLNYGALFFRFAATPAGQREWFAIAPALDAVPALALGAVLSLAFILKGQFDWLFGLWMGLYGLAHTAYRQSLPKSNYVVGLFYMAAGAACLLAGPAPFVNPWPMGIVFGAGELVGGFILHQHNRRIE